MGTIPQRRSRTQEYDLEEDDSFYTQRQPTSAVRYTQPKQRVIQRGNKRIIIHDEPLPQRKLLWSFILGIGMLTMLALWIAGSYALNWWQNHQLDNTYGMPRTAQYDQVVGHLDSSDHPTHFLLGNVITDSSVFVPAGSANGYGYATVAAHALISGHGGNLSPYSMNSVIGSSVYIRNLSVFTGGNDSYAVKLATAQDTQTALTKARSALILISTGLHYPCLESISGAVSIIWRCQMLTYHIPAFYHVTAVKIIGKNLLISVWFVARPARIWVR